MPALWWLFMFNSFFLPTLSAKKTWKFNNDILNPTHWENAAGSLDCNGFFFPEILGSIGSVTRLVASEVTLPLMGELEIQNGGYIELFDTKQCVRVKEIVPKHWLDPENWESGDNVAVPDVERVPCEHDDVVFQNTVAVYYPEVPVSVNSIELNSVKLSQTQWQNFLQTDYGIEEFQMLVESSINIEPKVCAAKNGCNCHPSAEIEEWICDHVPKKPSPGCFQPIRPVGFCQDICGGIVTVEVAPTFSLETFRQRLPRGDRVDIHASKIAIKGRQKVQVVFAEKYTYTERSQKQAEEFHATLMKDLDKYKLKDAVLVSSGYSLPEESKGTTAVVIVFGTLIGTVAVFFGLYVLYVGPLRDYDLRSRLSITQQLLGQKTPFFRKFDNEGVSIAASMVSLDKSFDNPMYGATEPSTSDAIIEYVTAMEERSQGKGYVANVIADVHDIDKD
ncbi:hypothetical protein PPYR_02008 [Photinus pyralis]|uniref:Protein amnionless n=2 Tax=Photinus pyralis TaxID=7054 RepID=A0A5N4B656_PHOPY|nr:protein amnionless isoform X1 [Photinus pyralis]KAB0805038.1 hypothetical protein PPYR_02008 [Photinus pyralis]